MIGLAKPKAELRSESDSKARRMNRPLRFLALLALWVLFMEGLTLHLLRTDAGRLARSTIQSEYGSDDKSMILPLPFFSHRPGKVGSECFGYSHFEFLVFGGSRWGRVRVQLVLDPNCEWRVEGITQLR